MRSIIYKKKTFIILAISLFLLFNVLAISNVYGATMQEDAVFNLNKDDPLGPEGYGALIPSPNTLGALYIDGTNQGKFTVTDWLGGGGPIAEKIVNFPGEDISLYYPTDLDGHGIGSMSLTDDIDPWNEVQWLNVSAYNAEAEILSPFTVSTVFDYYAMAEGGVFTQPFNYEHPMQIDLIVKSTGPKVLKLDWLTINPDSVNDNHYLIAPSGKHVDYYEEEAEYQGTDILYNYLIFTANEKGAYRFLIYADHTHPASLNLEFLDTDISSLPLNTIKFGGNFDDFATLDVSKTANWQSNWFKFTGSKGEVFSLDIYEDFTSGPTIPIIDIWTPSANGYFLDSGIGMGSHDIYFAKSGAAYISFTDDDFEDWYRYSLFLTKADNEQYTLGDKNTYSISLDDTKTIAFSLQQDSIVRFNYTSLPNPLGAPALDALGTPNAFIFRDSKEYVCYDYINTAIMTRMVDSTVFYWHYMPAGTYKAVIKNGNPLANGLFQISSQVYDWSEETIPVNTLTYPTTYPSDFVTIEFQPDSEFGSLKNPVGIDIEIPDIGQFRLNTTMWLSDNTANATLTPTYLYTYNATDTEYYSFGYPQPVFSLDGDLTANDFLYIGAPTIWTGMTFDFSTLGAGGTKVCYIYDGGWEELLEENDGTSELTTDGTIEFDVTDPNFAGWERGTGGLDIDPYITETDYFWMRLEEDTGDYSSGTVPVIQELTLLNATIIGDLQFILIGETGYEYDDYWGPSGIAQPADFYDLAVSLDDDIREPDYYNTNVSTIIRGGDPMTIGFEAGIYKLLIIPELWTNPGAVTIQFAVENYWDYAHHATYNIGDLTPTPNLHAIDITNYTFAGYSNLTGPFYNYGLTTEYNHTESILPYGGESYFALECYGDPYQWTQLVATVQGLGTGDYDLFILQDLPWIDTDGPNNEWRYLTPTNVDYNTTYEFGVFSDHFTLLFEVASSVDNVTFYLSLSQYDTVSLTTRDVKASLPQDLTLVIALAIIIPAAAGAVVVVYVLKKKGKILTKRPT